MKKNELENQLIYKNAKEPTHLIIPNGNKMNAKEIERLITSSTFQKPPKKLGHKTAKSINLL